MTGKFSSKSANNFHILHSKTLYCLFIDPNFQNMTVVFSLIACIPLYFLWPLIYNGLVAFGTSIIGLGAVGAGIYGFLNRLLIPVGLHHALNAVFWFDTANIADLNKFWGVMGHDFCDGTPAALKLKPARTGSRAQTAQEMPVSRACTR